MCGNESGRYHIYIISILAAFSTSTWPICRLTFPYGLTKLARFRGRCGASS
jgi:hypothetical protein